MAKTRDIIAHRVANFVLRTVASKEYQKQMKFTYALGIQELERRLKESK